MRHKSCAGSVCLYFILVCLRNLKYFTSKIMAELGFLILLFKLFALSLPGIIGIRLLVYFYADEPTAWYELRYRFPRICRWMNFASFRPVYYVVCGLLILGSVSSLWFSSIQPVLEKYQSRPTEYAPFTEVEEV
jgi:hypothetical protein